MPIGNSVPQLPTYEIASIYRDLRQQILTLDPVKLGLSPETSPPVWGVLMETGHPETVTTLVALTGGTASLYYSDGGGIISAEQHDGPRIAADELIALAPRFLERCEPAESFPLPGRGSVRFYCLTHTGVFTAEAAEDDLRNGRLPLAPLFRKAQAVIAQIRHVDEEMGAELG
ncbi:MAG: hypothetical protein ACM3ZC_00905 [Bacteroidota bacterium]